MIVLKTITQQCKIGAPANEMGMAVVAKRFAIVAFGQKVCCGRRRVCFGRMGFVLVARTLGFHV